MGEKNTRAVSEFASRLSQAMQDRSLTTKDLHTHLGITYEMARRYMLGMAMPRRARIEKIAELVQKTPVWLEFGDDGEREARPRPVPRMWPLKKATIDRFYALTSDQANRADAAFDAILTGLEAERASDSPQ